MGKFNPFLGRVVEIDLSDTRPTNTKFTESFSWPEQLQSILFAIIGRIMDLSELGDIYRVHRSL